MTTYKFAMLPRAVTLDAPEIPEPFTIAEFVALIASGPRQLNGTYERYHWLKSEQKRLKAEADQNLHDKDKNKLLRSARSTAKAEESAMKDGPCILPYLYKDDVTAACKAPTEDKPNPSTIPSRANATITHFSLIVLDIESKTSVDEIHAVLQPFEYVLWTTISHRPDDPRYRVVLFPAEPLKQQDALDLISRIDTHLPERNDLTKKTRNIDSACLDEKGRVAYLPAWLKGHPERFYWKHNQGALITAEALPLTEEQRQEVATRSERSEQAKLQRVKHNQQLVRSSATENSNIIVREYKGVPTVFLNPEGYLETEDDYTAIKDIQGKISGVVCPAHNDTNGSEFAWRHTNDKVAMHCKHCGTIWEWQDTSLTIPSKWKKYKEPAAAASTPTAAPREQHTLTDLQPPQVPTTIVTVDQRYLDPTTIPVYERGVHVIKSPKGTGKTEYLSSLVDYLKAKHISPNLNEMVAQQKQDPESILLLGHRIFLLSNLALRIKLAFYKDGERGYLSNYTTLCLNSLATRYNPQEHGNKGVYDTIIIDESEQVLQALVSGIPHQDISKVFNRFVFLIRNAKRIFLLDADITSDLTINVINMIRAGGHPDDKAFGLINNYRIGELPAPVGPSARKRVTMFDSQYSIILDILSDLHAGKKVFVASNSRNFVTKLHAFIPEWLKSSGVEKKSLLLTRDTVHVASTTPEVAASETQELQDDARLDETLAAYVTGTQEPKTGSDQEAALTPQQAFILNPSVESRKYDVVLTSPTLSTGVSIDAVDGEKHFDEVYGVFFLNPKTTYQDADQAISRVRYCNTAKVFFQQHTTTPHADKAHKIEKNALDRERETRKLLPEEYADFTEGEKLWAKVYAAIKSCTEVWSINKQEQFIKMREEQGFIFDVSTKYSEDDHADVKKLWNDIEVDVEDTVALILTARDIDDEEYDTLRRNRNKTAADKHAITKFQLRRDLLVFNKDTVGKALSEKFTEAFRNWKLTVQAKSDTLKAYDAGDRNYNKSTFTVSRHTQRQVNLLNQIEQEMGLDRADLEARIIKAVTERTADTPPKEIDMTDIVINCAAVFVSHLDVFNRDFGMRISAKTTPDKINEVTLKIWNKTLAQRGLPLTKKKRGPRDQRETRYFIDLDSEIIKKIVAERTATPECAIKNAVAELNERKEMTPEETEAINTKLQHHQENLAKLQALVGSEKNKAKHN